MKKTKGLLREYLKLRTNGRVYTSSWFDRFTDIVGAIVCVCGIGTIIYMIFLLIKQGYDFLH